ncbi:GTPase IMAP family member 9 isoform X4 [Patella vulgata]|uniref:GTPase IMAP family member 9 isoform X4 n=1 Tax=Patella vulgata TaxID=6465 RepID=UPI00217FEA85|nr:GTPase IMAP family member 9 isoform X4 [Patella vulgata]
MATGGSQELRVVMVGKTGRGKSALGNSLLRHKVFTSTVSGGSVTSMCKTGYRDMKNGKRLVVIDTPGLFDTRVNNDVISKELVRCIALATPGPHAFLFVLSVDRFTQEELDTVDHLQELFGSDVTKFVLFVFNGKDSLEFDEISLEEHIRRSPPQLQSLVDRCGGRIATINNRVPLGSNEDDVNKILSLVEQTIVSNGGEHYTDAMFKAADEVYQNKIRELEAKYGKRLTELELREQIRKETEEHDGILVTFAKGIQNTTTKIRQRMASACSMVINLFTGGSN